MKLKRAIKTGKRLPPDEELQEMLKCQLYEDTLKEYIKRFGRNKEFEDEIFTGLDLESAISRLINYVSGIENLFTVEEIIEILKSIR